MADDLVVKAVPRAHIAMITPRTNRRKSNGDKPGYKNNRHGFTIVLRRTIWYLTPAP